MLKNFWRKFRKMLENLNYISKILEKHEKFVKNLRNSYNYYVNVKKTLLSFLYLYLKSKIHFKCQSI